MRSLRQWVGALTIVVVAVACGSSSGAGGDGSGFGDGNGGGTSGSGVPGSLGASSGDPGDGGGTSGGNGACSGDVDMFIMFDRSHSMGDDCSIGDKTTNSKWCHAVNALSGYFNSPAADGQAAALQYFPVATVTDAICKSGDGYEVASVPTAPADYQSLPSNGFDSILDSQAPGSGLGTPTEAAIRGISRFTEAHRRPGRVTIGILVTDGDPNGCDGDLTKLSGLLDAHYQATKSWTFVIGMEGATFTNLEKIAAGGNTPTHPDVVGDAKDACGPGIDAPCRSWNVGNGDPAAFIAALAAIQQQANGCNPNGGGGFVNPVK